MTRSLLAFLGWIAICTFVHGRPLSSPAPAFQATAITGQVTDEAGSPLPGVNVIHKGTSNGTTTDADGKYSIRLENAAGGTLVFSFIGFKPQEVAIEGRSSISISMAPDLAELTEVVVVGYGVQEKRDVTSSISSISGDAITKVSTSNAMDAMKGQIAGVDVLSTGGRPGQSPSIVIRGRRSLAASNDPLFVIDGIPMTAGTTSINDFNPADIASVEVLKDAASQAIYGSRGSNGVILITTKRGKPGEVSVNFSTSYGVTEPFKTIPMMNGAQFADLKREANRLDAAGKTGRTAWGDAGSSIPSDAAVFLDAVEYNSVQNGLSTDWQDLIYHSGSQLNQQLSLSAGTEKSLIRMSFGNFKEKGIMDGTDYTRYSGRINADQDLGKFFRVGVSAIFSRGIQNFGSGSAIPEAVNQSPLGLPYDANGNIIFLPISDGIRSSPLSELVPGKRIDERKTDRVFTSAYLEAKITKGLTYKLLFGVDVQNFQQGIFEGQYTNTRKNGTPYASLLKQQQFGYTLENLLTYSKEIGDHTFGVTALQSAASQGFETSTTAAANLPYETMKWYNLGLGTITSYATNFSEYQLLSYMGRVNYSYKGKYLFQASMRWDGSSRLAPGNKWASFPGISAGWRIKDEGFMSGVNFLSELKLRASYGEVGNTAVAPYQTQDVLAGTFYDWNNADARGFRLNQLPSPGLSWEVSRSFDIGVDFGLFNNRLTGYFDYYHTSTGTSLLLNRQLPPTSGYASILQNIGGTETTGYEVSLNSTILDLPNSLKWTAEFNFGSLKEKIVDLAQRDADGNKVNDVGNGWFIGQPVRVFYDYEKVGIWQADEVDAAKVYGQFPGEIKLRDLNDDKKIDGTNDRKVLGNDVPKAYGGLNSKIEFKGFDFSFFFYYRLGFMINSIFSNEQATMQSRYNNLVVDYWTVDNPTNNYPRPNKNQESIQYGSTLNYVDGGFIKLRTVTLGYTLPRAWSDKVFTKRIRVYASAQNPLVWSKYKLFDPERAGNVTSGEMPSTTLYLGGIEIGF